MLGEVGLDEVVMTSLLTSGSATIIASFFGILLASISSSLKPSRAKTGLRIFVRSLYGLPPVVVGVWIYLMLSKQGVLADLDWLFTIQGMVLAQSVLVLPLIWGGVWSAFEEVNRTCSDGLKMTGGNSKQILLQRISLAKRGVLNSIAIGFGRAIAEVGAVLMVGGNIAGQTRVMTTSIVLETSIGNLDTALTLGFILLLITTSVMLFITPLRDVSRPKKVHFEKGDLPIAKKFSGAEMRGVNFSVNGKDILKDVDVEVKGGEILVLLGESGSGKTTLLKSMAGLLEVNGEVVGFPDPGLNGCQMVFQSSAPLTNYVFREIGLADHFHSTGNFIGSLAKEIGMEGNIGAAMDSVSGGEMQRVMVARSLAYSPSLLLLDEFTANLDGNSIERLESLVAKVRNEGAGVVISTHNVLQARRIADRVLIIHDGKIIASGGFEELDSIDDEMIQSIIVGRKSG